MGRCMLAWQGQCSRGETCTWAHGEEDRILSECCFFAVDHWYSGSTVSARQMKMMKMTKQGFSSRSRSSSSRTVRSHRLCGSHDEPWVRELRVMPIQRVLRGVARPGGCFDLMRSFTFGCAAVARWGPKRELVRRCRPGRSARSQGAFPEVTGHQPVDK